MLDRATIPQCNKTSAAEDYSAALVWMDAVLADSWSVKDWVDGPIHWRFFSLAETPTQGWKIHVSASAYESPKLLYAVVPILSSMGAAFKLPQRFDDVIYINSGDAGLEQLGKIITVYPHNDDLTRKLLTALDTAWPDSKGPEVCTDVHVRLASAVSFRFGVFRPGPFVIDSTGRYFHAVTLSNGNMRVDERRLDGQQPHNLDAPLEGYPPLSCPFQEQDEITVGGVPFVLLSVISKTPQSIVYLAANTTNFETAIAKIARPGVGGDASGLDCSDLLIRERQILSALGSQKVAPQPLGWIDGSWPTLVMTDVRGERLSELPLVERIAMLPHLARSVSIVHAAGFVHGDIKLENAIRFEGRAILIDFELAVPIGKNMRRGGTRGHLAPEIDDDYLSAPTRDVYALSGCLFQAIMGIPPGLLTEDPTSLALLLRNENALSAAELFEWLATQDPNTRPSADAAAKRFERFSLDLDIGDSKPTNEFADLRWCRSASINAAQAIGLFAQHSKEGTYWRNTHFQRGFNCEAVNIGAAGIILGLISIDSAAGSRSFEHEIANSARWLANAETTGKAAGLFTGNAGAALALALAARRLDNIHFLNATRNRLMAAVADRREADFFSGSAGVLFACCLIKDVIDEIWPIELADKLAHNLLHMVNQRDGIPIWGSGEKITTDYLGCAHGSAGFALALAAYGRATGDHDAKLLARETFAALHRFGRTDSGMLRMTLQDDRYHAIGNWCHGVAGYLWAMLQGFGDDPALRNEIDWAVECLSNGPAIGTPTYCHGLAGQLELWCMLGGVKRFEALANEQAYKVASALRILSREMDGHLVWASDNPDIVTPDLWVGFLGPATALALYASRSQSALLSGRWLTFCSQISCENEIENGG